MKTCYIVGAGDFFPQRLRPEAGDILIAADAGLRYLRELGVQPDLTVGDFDSLGSLPEGRVERSPVEKDDTDMLLAVRRALELGAQRLVLLGGTGGERMDHTLANIQTLLFATRRGAECFLLGDVGMTVIEGGALRFSGYEGDLSVFALGDEATGVTERGTKYLLEEASLRNDFPLGVSNAFAEREAEISVRRGPLLVVWRENYERELPQRLIF